MMAKASLPTHACKYPHKQTQTHSYMKILFVLYHSVSVVVAIAVVCLAICYICCSKQSQKRTSSDKQNPPPGNTVQNLAPLEDDESKMQSYVDEYGRRIDRLLRRDDVGFAIVVGMTAAEGAELDTTNMEGAFSNRENGLGFAVLKETDLSQVKLRALLKSAAKFPYETKVPFLKVICFYYAGHGGGDPKTNQPFIVASDGTTLHVQEIVKQFYPINTPKMSKNIQRLFLFDMCLGPCNDYGVRLRASGIPTRNLPAIDAVPAQGNCLVAFATSFNYTSGGDKRKGGFWTRFLHQNITKDQDIFEMLADTWEETVRFTNELARELGTPEIQGPSQTACMGHFNLRRKLPKLLVLLIHLFMYTIGLKDQAQAVLPQGTCTCMSISIMCDGVTCTVEPH